MIPAEWGPAQAHAWPRDIDGKLPEQVARAVDERARLVSERNELEDRGLAATEADLVQVKQSRNRFNDQSRIIGEHAGTTFVGSQYPEAELLYGGPESSSRSGDFDQVWKVKAEDGSPMYIVVEAKGGTSPLGDRVVNGERAQQGSSEYFKSILEAVWKGSCGCLAGYRLVNRLGQAADHQANKRQHHPGLRRVRQQVTLSVQTVLERHPRNATLHNPALLHHEGPVSPKGFDLFLGQLLACWKPVPMHVEILAFDDLHGEVDHRLHPHHPLPLVPTVGIQMQLECWLLVVQLLEELLSTLAITQVRWQDLDLQQKAQGVHAQMTFAALDLFPAVISFASFFQKS